MMNGSSVKKGVFSATVRANRRIGECFYRLRLEFLGAGAEAIGSCVPGQFVELDLSGAALPAAKYIPENLADKAQRKILLRRPFSFADVTVEGKTAFGEILYCVVGPGSLRMTTLAAGDVVSVIGPLGRGFRVPEGKRTALLAAGGMGAGPLLHLAKFLTANHPNVKVIAFAGAKTAKELPYERRLDEISQQLGFSLAEFAQHGIESQVATDDGSAGYAGLVTDCLAEWLKQESLQGEETIIYGCGPEAMLARLAEIGVERRIDCQVSMERLMACGIGVCMSCAVECKANGSGETVYKLCCKDGPVFDGKEVVFGL
ncbi:MAG TPA: dihydroorotate dehydrogenase electron transfer subunit [Sedimentisphaerales bacterium]|nr:dihydroorotate dehydrogenase electron transfer subunit [Sedimentisphaerales bacterium]